MSDDAQLWSTRATMPLILEVSVQCAVDRTVARLGLLNDVGERPAILSSQASRVLNWARQRLDQPRGDRLLNFRTA